MTIEDILSIVMEAKNDEADLLSPNSSMNMSNIRDDKQVDEDESPNISDTKNLEDGEAQDNTNRDDEDSENETDEDGMDDLSADGEEDPSIPEGQPQDEPDDIERKMRLRKNIIILHGYISAAINKNVSAEFHGDVDYHQYFLYTQSRLSDCKELLYKLASEDIFTKPYIECLHRYITIKNIFDACIKMREKLSPLKDDASSKTNNKYKENQEN